MLYILIIFLFLALSYCYDYRGMQNKRLLWWVIMMVILICVAGMRYKIGQDSIRYELYYADHPTLSQLKARDFQESRFGPLYVVFTSLCRSVTSEFMIVQFTIAIIVNSAFFGFIWKHTRHIFFAGLMYFLILYPILNTQVLREAIAASIFLWSWPFFVNKKWFSYYGLCLLAFFFHVSAIVLFLLPIILFPGIKELFKFGKRTIIIIPILLLVTFAIRIYLFDFIKMIAFTESMADRAETYSKSDLGSSGFNIVGVSLIFFKTVVYPLIAMYFLKLNNWFKQSYECNLVESMAMLGIYVCVMSLGVIITERYTHYFQIFMILLVADWVYTQLVIKRKIIKLNFAYWIVLCVPMFSSQIYMDYFTRINLSGTITNIDMYWPYSSQIDKEIAPNRKKAIKFLRNR